MKVKQEPYLMHYSPEFKRFLTNAIPGLELMELKSQKGARMPIAILRNQHFGTVINSLPFFGSHGGPLTGGSKACAIDLMAQFSDVAEKTGAVSATIIENPFESMDSVALKEKGFLVVDDRVGQFTPLNMVGTDIEASLFQRFHVKTRNAIRKGMKLGLKVKICNDNFYWDWMQKIHADSIRALGGVPKSQEVFKALREAFGSAISLHVGFVEDLPITALVTIKHRDTIEYFTPVIDPAYRNTQALSAVIFSVMTEAAFSGSTLWNWGGTWRSQEGVYRFKKRWGAEDYNYRYFNRIYNDTLRAVPSEKLATAFPYFYILRY
jgi:hypothetical protein|tara:strand:- start:559 stop:1524 length:966 start_codon:yes stop_codon:yes gene_type:complete